MESEDLSKIKQRIDTLSLEVAELMSIIKNIHHLLMSVNNEKIVTNYRKEVFDIINEYTKASDELGNEINKYIDLEKKLGAPAKLNYRRYMKNIKPKDSK